MHLSDVRDYIVRPALARINLLQLNREQLVIGTGGVESGGYSYLDQTTPGPGPAYGFWQMEKLTHDDLWATYINYQPSALRDALLEMAGTKYTPPVTTLHWNLMYGAAMCAMKYRRARPPLPEPGDYQGMAEYWKQHYNTPLGKGTVAKAVPYFKEACEL